MTLRAAESARARRRRRGSPPSPHDPRERVLVAVVDDWEVRLHVGPALDALVRDGALHLQYWHPKLGVSVLTASSLTRGMFEVYPVDHWTARVSSQRALALVLGSLGVTVFPMTRLAYLERALSRSVARARSRSLKNASSRPGAPPTPGSDPSVTASARVKIRANEAREKRLSGAKTLGPRGDG